MAGIAPSKVVPNPVQLHMQGRSDKQQVRFRSYEVLNFNCFWIASIPAFIMSFDQSGN